jgi:gamma-glutamylcyclotransferase (GGCT)/AIG2-like uncharacterized protein YtfP
MKPPTGDCLFAYGSLMYPEVWRLVTGGGHPREPARIDGFNRRRRKGEVYPVVYTGSESVDGILYWGLSAGELERLDRFEGSEYERRRVATTTAAGRRVEAWVYLFTGDPRELAEDPWDPGWFEREGLAVFLGRYRGFQSTAAGEQGGG